MNVGRSRSPRADRALATLAPVALVLIVGALLAASVLIAKQAASAGAPMLWFLALAMIASGAPLIALAAALGQWRGPVAPLVGYGLGAGSIMALGNVLGYLCVLHVGAGYVSLTYAFPVLLTYVIAVALGMERAYFLKTLAVVLGVAGGAMLARSAFKASGVDGAGWVAAATAAPAVIAAGNIFRTRYWPAGAGAVLLAGLMLALGGLALLPIAAFVEGMSVARFWTEARPGPYLGALIATFFVQYIFYFLLQRLAGPVYLSQIGGVAALVGAFLSAQWLGETLPDGLALSGAMIAAGVVAFQIARMRQFPARAAIGETSPTGAAAHGR